MRIFLSHAAEDGRIASTLKSLIERCSLGEASVWFSSDTSPGGGVMPGGPWFDQLMEKIEASNIFLALITPRSVDNSWLFYEAGCAATKRKSIIPVVAGLSVNDVRAPLSLYNGHNIAQPEALKTFLMRLYESQAIRHDETMLETPIQHAVRDIVAALSARPASDEDTDGIDRVLRLIDKRFMDLVASIPTSTVPSQTRRNATTPTYNLHLKVRAKGRVVHRFSIDVVDAATLQDIADACYFNLEDFVTPYKYLEQWIIRDMTASANIVAHDFMSLVKANAVLRPDHEYEVILLSRPYDPTKGPHQTLD